MEEQRSTPCMIRRAALLAGLLFGSALLSVLLFSPVRAQEALLRVEIDAPIQPVPKGEEFEARVLVEDVGHLAGFSFTLAYDPKRVEPVRDEGEIPLDEQVEGDEVPVRVLDVGSFLMESERGEGMICSRSVARDSDGDGKRDAVAVSCVTTGPPVCLDGVPGVSGSGLLARVVFRAKGGGDTTIRLASSTLALDDLPDCDLEGLGAAEIAHRTEEASVELAGGGLSGAVIAIIAVVVAVVIIGGAGGFLFYRRRTAA